MDIFRVTKGFFTSDNLVFLSTQLWKTFPRLIRLSKENPRLGNTYSLWSFLKTFLNRWATVTGLWSAAQTANAIWNLDLPVFDLIPAAADVTDTLINVRSEREVLRLAFISWKIQQCSYTWVGSWERMRTRSTLMASLKGVPLSNSKQLVFDQGYQAYQPCLLKSHSFSSVLSHSSIKKEKKVSDRLNDCLWLFSPRSQKWCRT